MKPVEPLLPSKLEGLAIQNCSASLMSIGNAELLKGWLVAVLASRQCPGSVLVETVNRVPEWLSAGKIVVSGFHSPLEQQVMRSIDRRQGRFVKVLARSFAEAGYRPDSTEKEALADGRMAIISACDAATARTTRRSAIDRNRLVLALSSEIVVPYVAPGSPLAALIAGYHERKTAQ